MRVVIIGAGNVATVLAGMIINANHEIIQVVGRDLNHARVLAQHVGCPFTNDAGFVDTTADIYVAAVGDAALDHLHESFSLGDKLIVHTAGALSKDVLAKISVNYGVMYPLQSLRKEYAQLHQPVPLLVDGSSETAISAIANFALTISSIVAKVGDDQRLKLHLGAVIVNNFTNHLYELVAGYCESEQIDFKMLQPLIEETAGMVFDKKSHAQHKSKSAVAS